jgi:hypothetical protein
LVSMSGQQSHAHHYVPQWYQRRFLPRGQSRYYYLDMNPDIVVRDDVSYRRNDLLHWGPGRCFYKDDLYTLRFGPATTDAMERLFFGQVDRLGMAAVTEMAEFAGIGTLSGPDAFRNLPPYMGAQRFRTPKGAPPPAASECGRRPVCRSSVCAHSWPGSAPHLRSRSGAPDPRPAP